jgi:hypothetical protein
MRRRPISETEQRRRAAERQQALSAPVAHTLETEAAIRAHEEPARLQSNDNTLANDILMGAKEIAQFLGQQNNLRNVYHWLETAQVSAFKMAGVWVSTKTRLREQFHTTQHVPKAKKGNGAEPEAPPPRRPIRSRPAQTENENLRRARPHDARE